MTTWADAPTILIPIATCPACGSVDRILVRSIDQGDGSRLQLAVCRRCSSRYRILLEIPSAGNCDMLPEYISQ
jgi:hypothetical protein